MKGEENKSEFEEEKESDIEEEENQGWLDEYIVYVEHQRDPIPSHVKTTVRAYKDAYIGNLAYKQVYNHYVRWPASYRAFSCHPTNDTGFLGSLWPNIQSSDRTNGKAHAQKHYPLA